MFTFTLPLRVISREEAAETEHKFSPARCEKSLSILVAEDNIINQKVIERILKKAGHSVVLVDDGLKAVEAAQHQSFDVVLMDVQMPVMDGVLALKEIRAREQGKDPLPVIVLTAHALAGDRDKYLAEGFDDYVAKPIRREDLFAKIQNAVNKTCSSEHH